MVFSVHATQCNATLNFNKIEWEHTYALIVPAAPILVFVYCGLVLVTCWLHQSFALCLMSASTPLPMNYYTAHIKHKAIAPAVVTHGTFTHTQSGKHTCRHRMCTMHKRGKCSIKLNYVMDAQLVFFYCAPGRP